jgi:DNA-binding transcriptional LysR family regulator
VRIDDMRLFAAVAGTGSISGAAQQLGMPKQTLSRRIGQLERDLGAQLLHRTTRRLRLTDVGAGYAERCRELVRLADDANRAVADAHDVPRGTLRITADPVFGEAFVGDLVLDYARRWPEVAIEVALTRRRVDLIEEGFDVAFRVGQVDDPALSGLRLGPARGPFRGSRGPRLLPVKGRLVLTSFAMAHAAARAGLGIAIFPEFACAADVRRRRLVPVLEPLTRRAAHPGAASARSSRARSSAIQARYSAMTSAKARPS